MNTSFAGTRRVLAGSPFNTPSVAVAGEYYAIDDRVTHDRFGLGKVVRVEGEAAVHADFGHGVVRRITLPSTKLNKL